MHGKTSEASLPQPPGARKRPEFDQLARGGFRVGEALLETDEAELIRDVCCDLDKAQKKLQKSESGSRACQEYAATELQSLAAADTKLTAAIVAALLSTQGLR
jgi:hypothetical protein